MKKITYRFEAINEEWKVTDRITVDTVSELIKCIEIYRKFLPNNGD